MINVQSTPIYELRGLKLIGWRDIQHALDCLYDTTAHIKSGILVAINAEKMLMLEDNIDIRNLIEAAEFKYADGISIICSLRKKYPNSHVSRIAGTDLWEALMEKAGINGTPVFLVGSRFNVLSKTKQTLYTKWQVNVVGIQDGYFKLKDQQDLFSRIKNSGAKIISVAMGSPLQEILMHNCQTVYPNALYIGVGGAYDVFSGYIRRASKTWQNLGLEWLYRLLSQPKRITRQLHLLRYLFWHCIGRL